MGAITALQSALAAARDTRALELGRGAILRAGAMFREQFPGREPIYVSDPAAFRASGVPPEMPGEMCLFRGLHAEWDFLEAVQGAIGNTDCIPIAIGSGTINDLVKLAAHRLGRPYMCIATAASMDGYTAYGASITKDGSKQTFECPAPRAVVADIDVIAAAPRDLTASGYADLLAKITAGADWIVADALGIEPIDPRVWAMVQGSLRDALVLPIDSERLIEGLLVSGFAMQAHQSSRPASGAEHQFSHLWDMEHATEASHGFKVGIGTLAVARLYEKILETPVEKLDVEARVAQSPSWDASEAKIAAMFDLAELRHKAMDESRAKYPSSDQLRARLTRLKGVWPDLKRRLRDQLVPASQLATMLRDAGAPTRSDQIGISAERLRRSHRAALAIRRRFTVLDLAGYLGLFDDGA